MKNLITFSIFLIQILVYKDCFSASIKDTTKINNDKVKNYFVNAEIKYLYQNCNGIDGGLNITHYNNSIADVFEYGLYLNCEYKFLKHKNIFAPKIGLGIDHMWNKTNGFGYNAKLSMVSYEPNKSNDLRFLPEVGITYIGVLNINYGYSIPINKNGIQELGRHVFSIGINFGYWRSFFNVMDLTGGGGPW